MIRIPPAAVTAALCSLFACTVLPTAQAQDTPFFDAPKLDKIAIDGSGDDWADRGLRVEMLTPVSGDLRSADDLSARLRVGWDDTGLLVLVSVTDNAASESDAPRRIWEKDSVELFLGKRRDVRDWLQWQIAPGIAPARPTPLVAFNDHRETGQIPQGEVKAEIVSRKTNTGYVIEARLPWSALAITPKRGAEVTFQTAVTDVDPAPGGDGQRVQWLWYPQGGASSDPARMYRLRLADKPSPPVTATALVNEQNFPLIRLKVLAPSEAAGKPVIVAGRQATLVSQNGWATASLSLPQNTVGSLPIQIDGKPAGRAETRDAAALRQEAIAAIPVAFHPHVFSGRAFPDCDFAEPGRMEDLIGPYTLDTEFYDAARKKVPHAEKPGRYGAIVTVKGADGTTFKRYLTLYRTPEPVNTRNGLGVTADLSFPPTFGLDPGVVSRRKQEVSEFFQDSYQGSLQDRGQTAVLLAGLAEAKPGEPDVQRTNWWRTDQHWWTLLRHQVGDLKQYAYAVKTPAGYEADTNQRWPLMLFLHGSGERGSDLKQVEVHGPLKEIRNGRDLPFIVIAPQCPRGETWNPTQLGLLLDEVEAKYRVDKSRVYCTGLSMGGYGTWTLGLLYPERFAAIVPICGWGDPADAARLKNVPVWAFHGGKDTTVLPRGSEDMVSAIKATGGDAKLTIYPEAGHDSWSAAYGDAELYKWLLAHQKK